MPSKDSSSDSSWVRKRQPVCHESIPAKEFCNLSNPNHSCHDYLSHNPKIIPGLFAQFVAID